MKLPARDHLYDLSLFAATVAVAAWQDWAATDLVWSLWISSLLVGYAFLVVTLFVGNDAGGDGRGNDAGDPIRRGAPALGRLLGSIAGLAGALFLLGFFTVHFGLFHFVHSVFLNQFFPLVDPSAGVFSDGGGPVWWAHVIGTATARYWPFLLATVVSRRADFAQSVRDDPERDTTMFKPYRNVVRMHVLIFVFAGLDAAGLSGYAIYPVLFFYFFPLDTLKALFVGDEAASAA